MPKLPSVYVRSSFGSSKVTYLDRAKAIEQLRLLAGRLLETHPEVTEVRLFGSLAGMTAVPGSDADVLIVLTSHTQPRWFDRIAEFQAVFAATDMPVEVFPYTQRELARLEAGGSGLARAARAGVLLARCR
ncbi:MAG: nucleotidyltransferase domain-containing protein [Phycisphaerae bacterium]